ncbi:MAG: hypothetical protein L6427_12365 [Actinomycetia bacterium]|nr:hypothetical protein [Actinomycetes bacterium]
MTIHQIGIEAVEYAVRATVPLQEWLEHGGQPPGIENRADVSFFYTRRDNGLSLVVGFDGFKIEVRRGRVVDLHSGDFTGESWAYAKTSKEGYTISVIEEPHGKPTGKKLTRFELSLVDAIGPTVYIPKKGKEPGWTLKDLEAQICWWILWSGLGGPGVEKFLTRYANRIWKDQGPAHLFDGSFKAPLSPLALKAHISYYRRLSVISGEPASPLSYPAKIRDMSYHLGVGERMLYRHAEAGLIPCEVYQGQRGRQFFFLEEHEPRLVEFYRERVQRKAIIAGWKKARGVSDAAAREWVRWHLRRGDTLDQMEAEIRGML